MLAAVRKAVEIAIQASSLSCVYGELPNNEVLTNQTFSFALHKRRA